MAVDNASSNDSMITYLRRKIKGWKGVVFGEEFLLVRCYAHIMNLIVNEGFKDLHHSIAAIRNAVRYVRFSPARLLKFKSRVEREKIEYKGLLVLDVPTRWNSTCMMLDASIKFQKAFKRYEEEDENGTLDVTSNSYFLELYEMQNQLLQFSKQEDSIISSMATSETLSKKVKDTLYRLFDFYSGDNAKFVANDSGGAAASASTKEVKIDEQGKWCLWSSFVKKNEVEECDKNEVDRYLTDPIEDPTLPNFTLLDWWKNNATKYKALSLVARDIFASPISTLRSREHINISDYTEEVNEYEEIESGLATSAPTHEGQVGNGGANAIILE
ncbi:zinc finger BED domain-containing protein RICESLEEPER 2-like [Morus notabilis]|uniref:zinc finger BED domain-containing protein RICESLEEPER 2-like n=1 Tax=Morus notabilis TaxID=981085 RepID=UPI000CED7875|nr:zinc finger BED domain-containing protein RICESLEEPER 2-like [Morus notabilis]